MLTLAVPGLSSDLTQWFLAPRCALRWARTTGLGLNGQLDEGGGKVNNNNKNYYYYYSSPFNFTTQSQTPCVHWKKGLVSKGRIMGGWICLERALPEQLQCREGGIPSTTWACPQTPSPAPTRPAYSRLVRQWDKAIVRHQQPRRTLGPLQLEAACYQHQHHWESVTGKIIYQWERFSGRNG